MLLLHELLVRLLLPEKVTIKVSQNLQQWHKNTDIDLMKFVVKKNQQKTRYKFHVSKAIFWVNTHSERAKLNICQGCIRTDTVEEKYPQTD